jgi:demethylmenaquinone methyltransferase/2-methoxy-6-polyprenyl-1,4-benzoquinol methylase
MAMMETGRPRVADAGLDRTISYVQGDAESISFPEGVFDIAMVGFGIRNLTDMEKGFREMYRVLKPGARLLCLEFSKPTSRGFRWLYDLYSFHIMPLLGGIIAGSVKAYTHLPESIRTFALPAELSAILHETGFSGIRHRSLTNGIATIHIAKK